MSLRVLVCGDREWNDGAAIRRMIDRLPEGSVVIEGEARGADSLARTYAKRRGLTVERYPANWDEFGSQAGPIRNNLMLFDGKPDLVVYFHHDLSRSKGTRDMVRRAEAAGVPVYDGMEWSRGH